MRERPLSPHLQIYRWTLTMAMSVLHRATGIALAVGTLMLVWMLAAAASGPGAYATFLAFAGSPLGLFLLLGWTASLFYHLFNGIRHMAWDMGAGYELATARTSGIVVLVVTVLATLVVWCGGL